MARPVERLSAVGRSLWPVVSPGRHRGGAGSDNLDTIAGGQEGDLLVQRASNSSRTIVAKDGTGNLRLAGDFTMDHKEDSLLLIYDGNNWIELSKSNNSLG